MIPLVQVSELLQQSTNVDFQVKVFHFETHFRVNRISRDAGSFPWANAERGKPRLAENVFVTATPQRSPHTHTNTQNLHEDRYRSVPGSEGFCTMSLFILNLLNPYRTNVDNTVSS